MKKVEYEYYRCGCGTACGVIYRYHRPSKTCYEAVVGYQSWQTTYVVYDPVVEHDIPITEKEAFIEIL